MPGQAVARTFEHYLPNAIQSVSLPICKQISHACHILSNHASFANPFTAQPELGTFRPITRQKFACLKSISL